MQLLTAILGSAQGLKGEVKADIRTDNPKDRFAKGTIVVTNNKDYPKLTIRGFRKANSKYYLSFVEITDRTMAESLCFTKLFVDTDDLTDEVDEDSFYAHELKDLRVYDVDNNFLGLVKDLHVGVAQDLLEVDPNYVEKPVCGVDTNIGTDIECVCVSEVDNDCEENTDHSYEILEGETDYDNVLVPFVYEIVLEVNLQNEYVVVDPPVGHFPQKCDSEILALPTGKTSNSDSDDNVSKICVDTSDD